jgi:hypothetical protein
LEEGVRAFILAEMKFNRGNETSQVNIVSEGMIAPPWKEEWDGYWDCPSYGRFFRFESQCILSSDSFFGRNSRVKNYKDVYFDKKKSTIYLDINDFNGERIVVSDKDGKPKMVYFRVDKRRASGEEMVPMSREAICRKY